MPNSQNEGKVSFFHSFQFKVTISVIALLVTFIIAVGVLCYSYLRSAVVTKTQEYMRSAAESCNINIERSMMGIEDVTLGILGNDQIQTGLKQLQNQELGKYESYVIGQAIRENLSHYALLKEEISSIYIINTDQDERFSYNKTRDLLDMSAMARMDEIYALGGQPMWQVGGETQPILSCARSIRYLPTMETLGVVVVNMPEVYIRSFYQELIAQNGGGAYVVDSDKRVLSSFDGGDIGEIIDDCFLPMLDSEEAEYWELDNGDSVYACAPMTNGWRLLVTVPTAYYLQDITGLVRSMLPLLVVIVVTAVLMALLLTRRLLRPVNYLTESMRQFGDGNFSARSRVVANDEIGMLSKTFNQMAVDVRSLQEKIYEQELLRKNAELKALKMQINPHFMFNVLDTINWMARVQGANDVGEMACSLGYLMHYSLSQEDFSTLEAEINSLEHYFIIQNHRYKDKLTAQIDISQELYLLSIPKLIIQPIAENAIIHGIEEKLEPGTVRISAHLEGEKDLMIQVEDDGVGIPEEVLQSIVDGTLPKKPGRSHGHIGVANVHKRIQLYYGEEYGVRFASRLGQGTCVTLHMPARTSPPNLKLKEN